MTKTVAKRARKVATVASVAATKTNEAIEVIVAETLDSNDIDAVIAEINASVEINAVDAWTGASEHESATETKTLREVALSYGDADVGLMVEDIHKSFERRDDFEESQGLSLAIDNSYTRERKRMLGAEIAVARFFLVLGISASDVIERKVASNAMFNAKALKKVTELARYSVGFGHKLEKVTRAFIACGLIASDRGHTAITNDVNRKFLNGSDFSSLIKDQELIDYLREQRHIAMTSGAETQSSQARNVLDVLGLGNITSVTRNRDAIILHSDHSFFELFRNDFMK